MRFNVSAKWPKTVLLKREMEHRLVIINLLLCEETTHFCLLVIERILFLEIKGFLVRITNLCHMNNNGKLSREYHKQKNCCQQLTKKIKLL